MRKTSLSVLAVVMVLLLACMPLSCFAASGINSYEQKLLDEGKAKIATLTMTTSQATKAQNILAQAESYMSGDGVDLTEEQYNRLLGDIDNAFDALPSTDVSTTNLTEYYNNSSVLMAIVSDISSVLGVTINLSSDDVITITSTSTGKTVGSTSGAVATTGVNMTYVVITLAAIAALVTGCAVLAKKKNLFAKDAE
jgi:hypothetical protein